MRYKESALGGLWSVVAPLALLVIYGVVYGVIFEPKWTTPEGAKEVPFALILFSGIVAFTLFAEIVTSATTLVQSNATLIKRTTVSVRVLPIASALGALFTFVLTSIAFLLIYLLSSGLPPATAVLAPLLVLPLWVLCLGLGFFVAAASAYFRDLQQLVPIVTTAVLFLSPVFYPETALPAALQPLVMLLSPIGVILPASKDLLFYGVMPDVLPLMIYSAVAVLLLISGYWVYGKAARGFADVV
jgi:lipopolysaccharide transport system permease protein